jgi:DNA polymerase III delta prime subunit
VNNLKEQGIGFYRNEMKTFCQSRGGIAGKKKMVVIDDIDMINEQSQQILRTYIDKYSANVHFVSVCANLHKVIESIQSRMHVMRIRQPSREQVAQMVDRVIETEALSVDLDARRFLLEYCNYSVRPVLNYLEKIKILEIAVSREVCETVVSEISFAKFEIFVAALRAADLRAAVRVLYDLHDHGYSVIDVLEYVFVFVKITESLSDAEKYAVLPLICKYIAIFNMTHEHHIELALFANNMLAALSTPKN